MNRLSHAFQIAGGGQSFDLVFHSMWIAEISVKLRGVNPKRIAAGRGMAAQALAAAWITTITILNDSIHQHLQGLVRTLLGHEQSIGIVFIPAVGHAVDSCVVFDQHARFQSPG